MNYQPLKYIYQPAPIANAPTLLLLHGTGGDERDLLPLASRFGKTLNVLSVRGNVLEGGMPRFFRRLGMGVFDEQDVAYRTHELVHFLQEMAAREGFDANQLVALGYSNGANIAGSVLMLYPELLAGAILLRPMQPLADKEEFKTTRQQPVFLSSGKYDTTVDPVATDKYSQLLARNGFQVSRHDLEAGHQLTQQDVNLAVAWYEANFARPDASY
jgi:phospholipase/carboxylesterase